MQRKISFSEGEYYHLYNRGVDKRTLFTSAHDYERFMVLLYLVNNTESVSVRNVLRNHCYEDVFSLNRDNQLIALEAFCLMPNHFHLLATPLVEDGISRYMLKLQTAYSMYFNIKNERTGSLFQGPFKSEHVDDDVYLKYLFSYIHLNPAKLKDAKWKEARSKQNKVLQSFVSTYPYSSLKEYLNGEPIIATPRLFSLYFSTQEKIYEHITDWFLTPIDQG